MPALSHSPPGGPFALRLDTPEPQPSSRTRPNWLALDIGGANIKAAHSAAPARTLPFELWKTPNELPRVLTTLTAAFPTTDRLALTMTAELCDCFPTKAVGVRAILESIIRAFEGVPTRIWGVDGRFRSVEEALDAPASAAASNWVALATVAARLVPEGPGLLIDVGSTTTDLIPLRDGQPTPRGRTDSQRLRSGELVYAGMRRTPLCAVAHELTWRGEPTGLAAEVFATTLDVYLTLGDVDEDPADELTADGRPSTKEAARDRLARMVGEDRDGFSEADARDLALAADAALMDRLEGAARNAIEVEVDSPRVVVVAGSGSALGRRLAERLLAPRGRVISLDEVWGSVASSAGCAHALVLLAEEEPL